MQQSPVLLITDANIWIDLCHGGILTEVFFLPYRIIAPDLLQSEMKQPSFFRLIQMGLQTQSLSSALVLELVQLRVAHRQLSVIDISAFLVARELSGILLSGDRRLIQLAHSHGVEAHGLLWLLDEMIYHEVLASRKAASALESIITLGARLPEEECRQRLAIWCRG